MKRLEITNEEVIFIGQEAEQCVYIFKDIEYDKVLLMSLESRDQEYSFEFESNKVIVPNLKYFMISGAQAFGYFTDFLKTLQPLLQIEGFYFHRTGMIKPPEFLWTFRNLTYITFRNEDINEIPVQVFDLTGLRNLSFQYCPNIKIVSDDIKKLTDLIVFDLWQASITYLSYELFLLPKIKFINFAYSNYLPDQKVKEAMSMFKRRDNIYLTTPSEESTLK